MGKKEKQKKIRIRKTMCNIRDRIEKLKLMKKFTKKSKAKAKNKSTRRIRRIKQQKGGLLNEEERRDLDAWKKHPVDYNWMLGYDKLIKKKNKETEELIEKQKIELENKIENILKDNKIKENLQNIFTDDKIENNLKDIVTDNRLNNIISNHELLGEEHMKKVINKALGKAIGLQLSKHKEVFDNAISTEISEIDNYKKKAIPKINKAITEINDKLKEVMNSNSKSGYHTTQLVVSEKAPPDNNEVAEDTNADIHESLIETPRSTISSTGRRGAFSSSSSIEDRYSSL